MAKKTRIVNLDKIAEKRTARTRNLIDRYKDHPSILHGVVCADAARADNGDDFSTAYDLMGALFDTMEIARFLDHTWGLGKHGITSPDCAYCNTAKTEVTAEVAMANPDQTPLEQSSLESLLQGCRDAARGQGWEGLDRDYEHTREDLEWVIERFGRKPTRDEWAAAGHPGVNDLYTSDEEAAKPVRTAAHAEALKIQVRNRKHKQAKETAKCRICGGNDVECLDSSGAHSICVVRNRKGHPTPKLDAPVRTAAQVEAFKIQQAKEMGIFNELGARMVRK